MSYRGMSPNAEIVSKSQALMVNVSAAKGLQGVLKSNLGALACVTGPDQAAKI
jgi:T-complex protein 1 subunit zeta